MRRLAVLGVLLLVIVLLGVAQLLLPGIAAHRIRSQLRPYGQVQSVSVSAFPAVELLWHHADSVTVRLSSFHADTSGLAGRLEQLSDVGTLHADVARVAVGLLTVRDARLVKHGSSLVATARVMDADLRGVLPVLQTVTPIASPAGQLILRGTANVLGAPVSVDFSVRVSGGAIVVAPEVPFGGAVTVTAFSDPAVRVTSVTAAAVSGGFTVRATGTLS
ncbi:MAG: hypothetical protein WAL22_09300 [Solirubrobacteraceae bacterium]